MAVTSKKERAALVAATSVKLAEPSIGQMIDSLNDIRERKRSLEAQLKEVEGEYEAISDKLMETLDAQGIDASRGTKASASITKTVTAHVTDWEAVEKYIKRTGYFHLFQRRLTDASYRELLEAGKKVPGVEPFVKRRLNLRAL